MLYRVQTIYLLIVALMSSLASRYSPFWRWDKTTGYDSDYIDDQIIMILFTLIAALAFSNIFLFKWKKWQIRINRLNIWLNMIFLALIFYWIYAFPGEYHCFQKVINSLAPISSIVFLTFSNKAIKKDHALIESMDRIR